MFDRRDEGRAKAGKAAIGVISTRTKRLVTGYLAALSAMAALLMPGIGTGAPPS